MYDLSDAAILWPQYTTDDSGEVPFARFSLDPDNEVGDLRDYWQPQTDMWLGWDARLEFEETDSALSLRPQVNTNKRNGKLFKQVP